MSSAGVLEVLERARDLGFLGGPDVESHYLHASSILDALDVESLGEKPNLLDMGSGGGVPGLIALMSDNWSRVVLVDRSERRGAFLRMALATLGPKCDCSVVVDEAESLAQDLEHREHFSTVSARSFGPPAATIECAAGFVRIGGRVVISDPPDGRNWPSAPLAQLGVAVVRSSREIPAWTVFEKIGPIECRFPRRSGLPVRRPLF